MMPSIWIFVRSLLAAVLLLTASMKVFDAAKILGSGGLLSSSLRLSLAVGFEVFAAIVIAVTPSQIAHRFGLLVFSGLAIVAAWAWWAQTDCGCFGSETPKGVPLIVDLVATGLLLACRRSANASRVTDHVAFRRQFIQALTVAVTFGLFAAAATNWRISSTVADEAMPAWLGENLIGMKMPLLRDESSSAADLLPVSGEALVVLLRPDCEHCHEVAQAWRDSEKSLRAGLVVIGVSVASDGWTVMPAAVSATPLGSKDEFVIDWKDAEEPFVAAPTFLAVRDQTVVGVVSGEDASAVIRDADWVDQLFGRADE